MLTEPLISACTQPGSGSAVRRALLGRQPRLHLLDDWRFGDWKIVHQRFSRWAKSGVFERIFKLLASDSDNEYMMIDATIVRAHQHSAGARKKTARKRSADRAAD